MKLKNKIVLSSALGSLGFLFISTGVNALLTQMDLLRDINKQQFPLTLTHSYCGSMRVNTKQDLQINWRDAVGFTVYITLEDINRIPIPETSGALRLTTPDYYNEKCPEGFVLWETSY